MPRVIYLSKAIRHAVVSLVVQFSSSLGINGSARTANALSTKHEIRPPTKNFDRPSRFWYRVNPLLFYLAQRALATPG